MIIYVHRFDATGTDAPTPTNRIPQSLELIPASIIYVATGESLPGCAMTIATMLGHHLHNTPEPMTIMQLIPIVDAMKYIIL